ncbi:MAG: putative ADP-ribose pyrophosphatase [Frankiales bacterium]|nr:putative ADP-ribose pyrophosphatase [Frankiales bacterium]
MEIARHCPSCGAALAPEGRFQRCTGCRRPYFRDPKVGVGVVVRNDAGQLLLVRRGNEPARGLWSLPAGFVDADEDPRAAAARECLEETGLLVEVGAVLEVYPSAEGAASFFLTFAATVVGGELRAGDDADEVGFFSTDHLPPLAFESTRAAVNDAGI